MADYYVVQQNDRGDTISVIIHFPVPAGNNDATPTPKAWQAIVAELRTAAGEAGSSQVPWATAPMLAALDTGSVYELAHSFQDETDNVDTLTPAQRATNLDAAVQAKIAEFTEDFAEVYQFYGTERTVA